MVVQASAVLERPFSAGRHTEPGDSDGRFSGQPCGLGSTVRQTIYGRAVVHGGAGRVNQPAGTPCCSTRTPGFGEGLLMDPDTSPVRQSVSRRVHQQDGRHLFDELDEGGAAPLELVPGTADHDPRRTYHRPVECQGGFRVPSPLRLQRLEASSRNLLCPTSAVSGHGLRSLRVPTQQAAAPLCELAARPRSGSDGRIFLGLDNSDGIRFSPVCPPGMVPSESGEPTHPLDCTCCPVVEGTTMVPGASEPRGCTAAPPPESTRPSDRSSRGPPSSDGKQQPDVRRAAAVRDRLAREGVSAQAADLLMASWHPETERAYRSAWQQWTSRCSQRETEPLCPSPGEVLDFLTELFYRGRQYRTLSGYRSALSMTLSPVNGVLVGQHVLVSRLLKGAYHSKLPQPRYRLTWDVEMVLRHLRSIDTSNLRNLTGKTLMLLALASAVRVADLFLCDTRFITVTEEKAVLGLEGLRKTQRVEQAAQALDKID